MARPLTGIRADSKQSYASIEAITSGLRKTLGLEALNCFNARDFFNQQLAEMRVISRKGSVNVREAVEDCSQEGLTRWDDESEIMEVVLSPMTYSLLQEDHVRARSTVAHEWGHACLHTDQIIRLAGMSLKSQVALHRERGSHQACEDTEWQANAFASSLLMPASGIIALESSPQGLSAESIAITFGVSVESAGYRLETYRRSLGLK